MSCSFFNKSSDTSNVLNLKIKSVAAVGALDNILTKLESSTSQQSPSWNLITPSQLLLFLKDFLLALSVLFQVFHQKYVDTSLCYRLSSKSVD